MFKVGDMVECSKGGSGLKLKYNRLYIVVAVDDRQVFLHRSCIHIDFNTAVEWHRLQKVRDSSKLERLIYGVSDEQR